jgi:hypothetical protein
MGFGFGTGWIRRTRFVDQDWRRNMKKVISSIRFHNIWDKEQYVCRVVGGYFRSSNLNTGDVNDNKGARDAKTHRQCERLTITFLDVFRRGNRFPPLARANFTGSVPPSCYWNTPKGERYPYPRANRESEDSIPAGEHFQESYCTSETDQYLCNGNRRGSVCSDLGLEHDIKMWHLYLHDWTIGLILCYSRDIFLTLNVIQIFIAV